MVFLVAFFLKRVKGTAIIVSAVIAETIVVTIHVLVVTDVIELGYLMYNVIGCLAVIVLALLFSILNPVADPEVIDG